MEIDGQKKYLIDSFLSLIKSFSVTDQKEILDNLQSEFHNKILSPTSFFLPVYIFQKNLGALESICKYLRDDLGLTSKKVSSLVGRTSSTVDVSYRKAMEKHPGRFVVRESGYTVPLSVLLSSKKFGVQEAIVGYFRDHYNLNFRQIADLLHRNYQTVRTAYVKYISKQGDDY